MVRMKTRLCFRESDRGAYDFAARKNTSAEKHAKGRSPFRDSPNASPHRDARFRLRARFGAAPRQKHDQKRFCFDESAEPARRRPRRV